MGSVGPVMGEPGLCMETVDTFLCGQGWRLCLAHSSLLAHTLL